MTRVWLSALYTKSLLIEERDKGGEKVRREKEDEQTDESQGVKTKVEGN